MLAIVLKGEKALKGRLEKKQRNRKEIKINLKNYKSKLWSLRKKLFLSIFNGSFKKTLELINISKNNIKEAQSQINKLNEEIYGLAKGYQGEELIADLLKNGLSDDFYIISGKKIKINGDRVEIDNIVVGPKGIICIEVKNLSGRFYFNNEEEGWLKAPFSNPNALKAPVASPLQQVKNASQFLKTLLLEKKDFLEVDVSLLNWHEIVVFTSDNCVFVGINNRWELKTPLLFKDELLLYISSLSDDFNLINNNNSYKLSQAILS